MRKFQSVSLKEVLDEKFPSNNKLEVGLGRDISGDPITVPLNEMPHLLVAGSTGSGNLFVWYYYKYFIKC